MKIYKCDKCKKELNKNMMTYLDAHLVNSKYDVKRYDICIECLNKIIETLE